MTTTPNSPRPTLIFTLLNGNPRSVAIIETLRDTVKCQQGLRIFPSEEEMKKYFEENHDSLSTTVALCDYSHWLKGKCFRIISQESKKPQGIPPWALTSSWMVIIGSRCQGRERSCAYQINADFDKNFDRLLERRNSSLKKKPKKKKHTHSRYKRLFGYAS